jgi:uncharacterized protein (DUF697 family)
MANVADLNTIWRNIREIDLQSFRNEALREVRIALIGAPGSGRHTLADNMRCDPSRPQMQTVTPVLILDLDEAKQPFNADLILVIVDTRRQDYSAEMAQAVLWNNQGKKVVFLLNQFEPPKTPETHLTWPASRLVAGPVTDDRFLLRRFVPLIMEILPDRLLGLGRQFPLFRVPIANHLINEACFTNATYALGTGLAEVVAVLNLPLTLADMVVLTKGQAFLVFKLGLVFGFSMEWRDYLAEFGSVVGGGFVWRQMARSLVGLIPVLGIVPKVGVAYSGTYVVGHTILQWYLTGRHLSAQQMKALTVNAFQRGQETARQLAAKMRRPRLEGGKKKGRKAKLPALETTTDISVLGAGGSAEAAIPTAAAKPKKKGFGWGKKDAAARTVSKSERPVKPPRKKPSRKDQKLLQGEAKLCLQCGKPNAPDANFCQYCAAPFDTFVETQ